MKTVVQKYYHLDFILRVDELVENFSKYCDNHNKQYINSEIFIGKQHHKLILTYKQL